MRGDAWPTMVSTISSAPPESARSFANIAPSAMRMPTLAAVLPNPSVNDASTVVKDSPATTPTANPPKIRPRNGCSFTTVMSRTMTAMPTANASANRGVEATGSASSGASASRVTTVFITSPVPSA